MSANTNGKAPKPNSSHIGGCDKIQRYGWTVGDRPGTYQEISKQDLRLDAEYQRDTAISKARDLARDWSWIACGTLAVARRANGDLYVIDGGHRLLAARNRSDIDTLPCMVFEVADTKAESGGFIATNQRTRRMNACDLHRAQVHNGDPAAIAIDRAIQSSGMRISPTYGATWDAVRCIGTVRRCYDTDAHALVVIWPLIAEAARTEGKPITDRMVAALHYIESRLIAANAGASLTRRPWRERILALGCTGIHAAACKAAAFYAIGGPKVYATGVLREINRGLRNRLSVDTIGDDA